MKLKRVVILSFAIATSLLVDEIEELLEEYECNGELTDKQLSKTRKKLEW